MGLADTIRKRLRIALADIMEADTLADAIDAATAAMHSHSNTTALNAVSGVNTGDNTTHADGDGSDHADVATNTTHSTSDGTDHTFIDQDVRTTGSPTFVEPRATTGLVLPKGSGKGIKVDPASPTFGWRDLFSAPTLRGIGANNPTWAVYRAPIRQFQYAAADEIWCEFHLPHDYVPGTDLYIHTHWSQIVVDTGGPGGIPGDVEWIFSSSYSKGHQQAPFSAPKTVTVVQTASGTQYMHNIAEVRLSTAGGSGTELDTADIEIDGLILVHMERSSGGNDTLDQNPFVHFVDIHYQSTGVPSKNKAPDFYT